MIPFRFVFLFLTTAICATTFAQQQKISSDVGKAVEQNKILFNIPVNSDKRCIGIAVVSEMLLEGPHLEHEDHRDLFQIAQQLYDSLVTGKKFQLHHKIMIEGAWVPTHSRIAIDKLSTLVTDKYKSDFFRIQKTEAGRHKLVDVQDDFLTDFAALNRILDADPDNIEVFCGIGDRVFPDGMVKETAHAFLLGKQQDREIVVYDPNDPGKPIECKITNTQGAIAIEWTCRYRRTGKITTQQYRIVPKDQFFRVFAEQR